MLFKQKEKYTTCVRTFPAMCAYGSNKGLLCSISNAHFEVVCEYLHKFSRVPLSMIRLRCIKNYRVCGELSLGDFKFE